jgi:type I restriction enzyme M protein
MNDKILPQLLDVARKLGVDGNKALSMTLQLLCWWKLSKEQLIPEGMRFEALVEQGVTAQLNALRSSEASARHPFIEEWAWQNLADTPDISPLIQKIRVMVAQGLFDSLVLDDAAILWLSESRIDANCYPLSLCDLLIALAHINNQKRVYIPWEMTGQIAARAIRSGARVWVESQEPFFVSQVLNLTSFTGWEMHHTDPISAPRAIQQGRLIQFDAAVCVPPMIRNYNHRAYENDLWERFVEKTTSSTVLQIRHLLAQTHGRIVVLVPNSLLFGKGAEKLLREDLIKHGQLQAVIALPEGLLNSSVLASVLILNSDKRSNTVRFVDANNEMFREPAARKRSEITSIPELVHLIEDETISSMAVNVTETEIAANDFSLEVGRYVLDESALKLRAALARYETRKIGDFFEIIRPRQHSTASSGAKVLEVLAQDIPQFGYIQGGSKESLFELGSPKSDSYFIRSNDILMTFKGVVGKAGIAGPVPTPGKNGWVAGQSLVVLRSRLPEFYPPEKLLIYLRSPIGQGVLSRLAVSASIPSIQLSALKDMEIPIAPLQEMQQMVHVFHKEAKIQTEIEQLRIQQAELTKEFWSLQ